MSNLSELYKRMLNTLIIIFCLFNIINATKVRRYSPLLLEDDSLRRANRESECRFGNTIKELGETWNADLGPPIGIMYCLKCECVPLTKRNKIFATVQCRDVKSECPKTTCVDPIQLPEKCCKSCPADEQGIIQDVPIQMSQEQEEEQNFGALLTSRSLYFEKREENQLNYSAVATGRFSFHKHNLFYSFYTSKQNSRPRIIQFLDGADRIIEEQHLESNAEGFFGAYQRETGKVCGVWRRISRDYRKLLNEQLVTVVLLWGEQEDGTELAISGRISKFPSLSTEIYSALLKPPTTTVNPRILYGTGGTAIISTSTESIQITFVVCGIFNSDEISDISLSIRLESSNAIILNDIVKIKKPAHDYNIIEFKSPLKADHLTNLIKGNVLLTVESLKYPDLKIQGYILTRASCELHQTLLAPINLKSQTTGSGGVAWFYFNKNGSLNYNILSDEIDVFDKQPTLQLIDDVLERPVSTINMNYITPTSSLSTIGKKLDNLEPQVLQSLYAKHLALNIAQENDTTVLHGLLAPKYVSHSLNEPILLKRANNTVPTHLMGMAWIGIDNECLFYYEITLKHLFSNEQVFQIYIEEMPIPGVTVSRQLLDEFSGHHLEGFSMHVSSIDMMKLESSVCYLAIKLKNSDDILLRGNITITTIPNYCYTSYKPHAISSNEHNDDNLPTVINQKCYYSQKFYEEGAQWKSDTDTCSMCSCLGGLVKCDSILCPPLNCKSDEIMTLENECCPICIDTKLQKSNHVNASNGCQLGDQFHLAGSSWHPYLPPNGFDTCAICSCNPDTLVVSCPRIKCPALNCHQTVAYRPDKKSCCKICPDTKYIDTELLRDQGLLEVNIKSKEEQTIKDGGCLVGEKVYQNGQAWHPIIPLQGEQKCVKCLCNDKHITCERKRCFRSNCNNRTSGKRRAGAYSNPSDECCSNQCRRRRHHNQKRFQNNNDNNNKDKKQLLQS